MKDAPASPRATPQARDFKGANGADALDWKEAKGNRPTQLNDQMHGAARPRAAPQARDFMPPHTEEYVAAKKALGHGMANLNDQMARGGAGPNGSSATTAKRAGSPTPEHPCWLQGIPVEFLPGAAWATRSAPRSRSKR